MSRKSKTTPQTIIVAMMKEANSPNKLLLLLLDVLKGIAALAVAVGWGRVTISGYVDSVKL